MRPTTEDLLKLRDGEPGSAALAAALDDPAVRREVARMEQVRAELRALPELEPPAGTWDEILRRARPHETPDSRPHHTRWHWPARLALAASVALTAVVLIGRLPDGNRGDDVAPSTTVVDITPGAHEAGPIVNPSYASLAAESRRLEQLLTQLSDRPRITNAGTAGTIAELEDRIALVDYQLATPVGTALTQRQRTALWQQRVDLMNSLVMVRYAEAQGSRF